MSNVANALNTRIAVSEESTYGVKPADNGDAFTFGRVSLSLSTDQNVIDSAEIKESMQTSNIDRGMKGVKGTLKGELAPGTYDKPLEAILRQRFNTGVVTDITLSDVSAAVMVNNLTTSGTDWSVVGQLDLAKGDIIQFNGFTGSNAVNNNLKWVVLAFGAGTMKLGCTNAQRVMLADAAGESITVTNTGTLAAPKNKVITRTTIAAVADTAIFATVAGDFTTAFAVGNIVKHLGFTGGSAPNDDKSFAIRKITATEIYGYYTSYDLPVADAAGEAVNFAKVDTIQIAWTAANALQVTGTGSITVTDTSFVAEGFKVHDVVQLVGTATTSTNLNRNLIITSITSISGGTFNRINFAVLDSDRTLVPMVVEAGISGMIIRRVGKKSLIPQKNHLDQSFSIERFYKDIPASEVFTGCKFGNAKITAGNSAIPTIDIDIMGQNVENDTAQQFTLANDVSSGSSVSVLFAGIFLDNVKKAVVTSFDLSIQPNLNVLDKAIGSELTVGITAGIYKVSGSMTAYFQSTVDRDIFLNKEEHSLVLLLRVNDAYNAKFIAFQMPRVIYNSSTVSEEVKGNTITLPFTAYENPTGDDAQATNRLQSMLSIQIYS